MTHLVCPACEALVEEKDWIKVEIKNAQYENYSDVGPIVACPICGSIKLKFLPDRKQK